MSHDCGDPDCMMSSESYDSLMMRQEMLIETYGYSIINTSTEDGLVFSYTVGRAQQELPELIIFGIEIGQQILNDIAPLIGRNATDGFFCQDNWAMPLYAGTAKEVGDFALIAFSRQARIDPHIPVRVMQVVIPDANGRMPWDKGCHPTYADQPLYIAKPQGGRMH